MGEVVNLRQARKRAARAEEAKAAEENRARHGLTKAERQRIEAEAAREAARLDAHRRGSPGLPADPPAGPVEPSDP